MVQNKTAWKHGAARAVKAIFAVLGALTIVFFAFFGGEFSTLKTLNRVEDDANLFTMEYKADYALDRFLKIGASTDTELIEIIVRQVLKGLLHSWQTERRFSGAILICTILRRCL